MIGLKISVQSKVFFCHNLEPEVSSFILADFSGFVSFFQDRSAVPQVQPYGSWKLQAVQVSYLQGFQDFILSGIHIWNHIQCESHPKKKPISNLYISPCAQNREDFS